MISFSSSVNYYTRTPQPLIFGLAKIGGLFGLFKLVSLLLLYVHEKLFKKRLENGLMTAKAISENDRETKGECIQS